MSEASYLEVLVGICVGISLAASCGLRVFVPLFIVSIAVRFFGFPVNEHFAWVGSWLAVVILGTATIAELLAYYIPLVDNTLDMINVPLTLIAGTVMMCGVLPELHPCLKWGIAVVLGGGAASMSKLVMSIIRGVSTSMTSGFANHIVATCENVCAVMFSIFSILIPFVCFSILLVILIVLLMFARKIIAWSMGFR